VSIAASVLGCFTAHAELGATQVARELGVAKSTACRMLSALAAFDDRVMADTLAVPRTKHTPFTITDPERLHRVLRAARAAGWVATREEFTRGFSSVAAPVLASGPHGPLPVAAISVVGPTARILDLRRDFIVASVCRAAARVSILIGNCLCSAAPNTS